MARMVFLISAVGVGCLASGLFLWQYGAQGLWLPPCAAIGALIAMLVSQALLSRVMMGIAAIVGGAIGAMFSISRISPCIHSEIPAAPYVVFVGAILGAAIWVIGLSVSRFSRWHGLADREKESPDSIDRRQKTSEYLLVSIGSFVIGPILGAIFMLAYHVGVGIEPLDNYPVFGYPVGGMIGALLCAVIIGAIGGAVFGIPYLMAWLLKTK